MVTIMWVNEPFNPEDTRYILLGGLSIDEKIKSNDCCRNAS